MKAPVTFFIGGFVAVLSLVRFVLDASPVRFVGLSVGLILAAVGWLAGWTRYRGLTVLLGHLAVTAGCLVTAYAVYRLPSIEQAPRLPEVLDLPLFWGLFTIFGGYCMITHGYCSCCIRQHEAKRPKEAG